MCRLTSKTWPHHTEMTISRCIQNPELLSPLVLRTDKEEKGRERNNEKKPYSFRSPKNPQMRLNSTRCQERSSSPGPRARALPGTAGARSRAAHAPLSSHRLRLAPVHFVLKSSSPKYISGLGWLARAFRSPLSGDVPAVSALGK